MKTPVAIFLLMLLVVVSFWYFMPSHESSFTRQRIAPPAAETR